MIRKRILPLLAALIILLIIIFEYSPMLLSEPYFHFPVPKKNVKIVALGDSLTKGEGDMKRGGYVGYVKSHLEKRPYIGKVTVYNYGVVGDTSDDLLKVMKSPDVIRHIHQADLILFTIGGNDVVNVVKDHFLGLTLKMFQKKRSHYQSNLKKVFTILRKQNPSAPIIYTGIYNPFSTYFPNSNVDNQIVHRWSKTGRQVASKFPNTTYVKTYDLFAGRTHQLLSSDHFHPDLRGYDLIGKRVMKAIQLGEQPSP